MKKSITTSGFFIQFLGPALVFTFIIFTTQTFAAFVPANEPVKPPMEFNPVNMREASIQLALMSNRDIEAITGKKLTLKEKAGLYLFRKQFRKKNKPYFHDAAISNDDCFTMYLKNGDVLEVKVIQITTTEIKYQRCNKPGDPEIIIAKTDVFSIKDSKGDAIYSSKDESWKKGNGARDGETDKLALASGITGIAALTLGFLFWPVGLAAGIAAGIMGIMAMGRFKTNRNLRGEGWAITGITAGGLWVFFGILILIALASGW